MLLHLAIILAGAFANNVQSYPEAALQEDIALDEVSWESEKNSAVDGVSWKSQNSAFDEVSPKSQKISVTYNVSPKSPEKPVVDGASPKSQDGPAKIDGVSWESPERVQIINPITWSASGHEIQNDQPQSDQPLVIPDQKAIVGHMFKYTLPKAAFESEKIKRVEIYQAPRMRLPLWLLFDRDQLILTGLPSEADIGDYSILMLTSYKDRDDTTSHLFHILVIPDDVFERELDQRDLLRYNIDASCKGAFPLVQVLYLNVNINFLQTYQKLDIIQNLANSIGLAVEQIQVGPAGQLTSGFDRICNSRGLNPDPLMLIVRFLSKKCDDSCKYAERTLSPFENLNVGTAVVIHWALYRKIPAPALNQNHTFPSIPWNIEEEISTGSGNFGYNINYDLLPSFFSLMVGQIFIFDISPNLVQGETSFVLEPLKPKDRDTFHKWIYIETVSTDSYRKVSYDSRLVVIATDDNIGSHEFCLRPKSSPQECIPFKLFVEARSFKENHRFVFVFDYDYHEFDEKVAIKQDLAQQLLKVADGSDEDLSLTNVHLHSYERTYDNMVSVSVSFFDIRTSLCRIRPQIERLHDRFVTNETRLSQELRHYCRRYRPRNATLKYFGPCAEPATGSGPAAHLGQSDVTVSLNISTVILIVILCFVMLVLIGVTVVFALVFRAHRKTQQDLYQARESFCGMAGAKSTPVIFTSDLENMSSRSSSPKQYASIYPKPTPPPSISPLRLLSTAIQGDPAGYNRASSVASSSNNGSASGGRGGHPTLAEMLRNSQQCEQGVYDLPSPAAAAAAATTTFAFRGRSPAEMLYQTGGGAVPPPAALTATLPRRHRRPDNKVTRGNSSASRQPPLQYLQLTTEPPNYAILRQSDSSNSNGTAMPKSTAGSC